MVDVLEVKQRMCPFFTALVGAQPTRVQTPGAMQPAFVSRPCVKESCEWYIESRKQCAVLVFCELAMAAEDAK